MYRALRLAGNVLAPVLAGIMLAGCSVSMPVLSLQSEPEVTGSIDGAPAVLSPFEPHLDRAEWGRAQNHFFKALDPHGPGQAAYKEGELQAYFSATGAPFLKRDRVCRSYTARIERNEKSILREGVACRLSGSVWELDRS